MATVDTFYALNPSIDLRWVNWDDETVIFDVTSGQTHLLDAMRAFVLNALDTTGTAFDMLLSELSELPNLSQHPELPELLRAILGDFDKLGLVEVIRR